MPEPHRRSAVAAAGDRHGRHADAASTTAGPARPTAAAASPRGLPWALVWTTAVSVALSIAFLLAPPMGTDLAAQQARADFFAEHGTAPVDFGWYGGVAQFGYSLLTAPLGSLVGMRLLGAVAAVASSLAFLLLLWRTSARRPLLGGVLGAVVFAANLVSGRITFAVGLALAVAALAVAAGPRRVDDGGAVAEPGQAEPGQAQPGQAQPGQAQPGQAQPGQAQPGQAQPGQAQPGQAQPGQAQPGQAQPGQAQPGQAQPGQAQPGQAQPGQAQPGQAQPGQGRPEEIRLVRAWSRTVAVVVLGALATWASPVAGLFAGLAGAAVLLAAAASGTGVPRRAVDLFVRLRGTSWREALALCVGPVLALAPMALLFGNGGRQPFTAESMRIHVALAVLVMVVVPARYAAIRFGAGLTVVLLVGAFALASPIGSNALRLPMLFTIPVVAAYAKVGRAPLALLLAAVFWWQPFVVTPDLGRAGSAESGPAFYRPLVEELRRRAPGRVEVVPLRDHWEAAYVANVVPLARGWERQVDTDRNALFYRDELAPADYTAWLRENAVSYVAFAPGSVPDRYARTEATLVRGGLPELRPVWQDATWQLFAVANPEPLVAAPGELVRSDRGGVTLRVAAAGDVLVRVRWSRWLGVRDGAVCLAPAPDGWTMIRARTAGEFRLTSDLRPGPVC